MKSCLQRKQTKVKGQYQEANTLQEIPEVPQDNNLSSDIFVTALSSTAPCGITTTTGTSWRISSTGIKNHSTA
jgi:hypothetical protein